MAWFGGFEFAWSQPARPQLPRRISQKVDSFRFGKRRTGSLILNKNDLVLCNAQTELENLKRKGNDEKIKFQSEKDTLKAMKQKSNSDVQRKLQEMLDDKDYERIIRLQYEFAGLEGTDDLKLEVQLLRQMHQSMLYQTLAQVVSGQSNDDIMEFYGKTPKVKEEMSEREAKVMSELFQFDSIKNDMKQLNERRIELYANIIEKYKEAEKDKQNWMIKEEDEEEDLKVRARRKPRSRDVNGQHRHLETLNQPKNVRSDDEKSLGDDDLFDEPKPPPPKKPLLAAAKKAREQREAEATKRMEAKRRLREKEIDGSNNAEKQESREETAKKRLEARRRERGSDEPSSSETTNEKESDGSNNGEKQESREETAKKRLEARRQERGSGEPSSSEATSRSTTTARSTETTTRTPRVRPDRSPVRSNTRTTRTARSPVRATTDRRTARSPVRGNTGRSKTSPET
jgi:hypothetical protein